MLHFDAHLDTWDVLHGATLWHGSALPPGGRGGPARPATTASTFGIRGGVYDPSELADDRRAGFEVIRAEELLERTIADVVDQVRARLDAVPVYVSVDIDVLDPAFAPPRDPEAAGLPPPSCSRCCAGCVACRSSARTFVEVSPSYDHAGITGLAAAHTAWELITLMGLADRP